MQQPCRAGGFSEAERGGVHGGDLGFCLGVVANTGRCILASFSRNGIRIVTQAVVAEHANERPSPGLDPMSAPGASTT